MNDVPGNNANGAEEPRVNDTSGAVASEVDGPSGADVTGGDITFPQDAEEASQENQDTRIGEEQMWEQQHSGEVGMQTEDLKPSPGPHEEGMPVNPTGSESSSGGANSGEETNAGNAAGEDATQGAEPVGRFDDSAAEGSTQSAEGSELAETKEKLAYLAAEFENYKRQAARRESETRERTVKGVVLDLLPVLDNFERAVMAAKNARDVESLRVGVEYILQQFREALRSHGVEPLAAHGQTFDPIQHDALEEVQGSEHPEGTVIEETQSGYSYKGQVLRPSRVKVAGGKRKKR
ncbi:MAG TPA: nucleotide exchange factor GrpE [Abditibacteriaceae bacterium]|nr:nucleotide exchange factor GrpE [Abditibacteriaceae bacterium]